MGKKVPPSARPERQIRDIHGRALPGPPRFLVAVAGPKGPMRYLAAVTPRPDPGRGQIPHVIAMSDDLGYVRECHERRSGDAERHGTMKPEIYIRLSDVNAAIKSGLATVDPIANEFGFAEIWPNRG